MRGSIIYGEPDPRVIYLINLIAPVNYAKLDTFWKTSVLLRDTIAEYFKIAAHKTIFQRRFLLPNTPYFAWNLEISLSKDANYE